MTAKNIILKTPHPVPDNRTIVIDALRRIRIAESAAPPMVHAPEEQAPQIGEIEGGDTVAIPPEGSYHREELRKYGPSELPSIAQQPSIRKIIGFARKR